MKLINNKEYWTPTELLEIDVIKKRFKTSQKIGYFIMIFSDKIDYLVTRRSTLIYKDLFVRIVNEIEKIKKK